MKTRIIHVLNAAAMLKDLSNTKMKISVGYKVNKIIAECKIVIDAFEEKRIELLKLYAEKQEDGSFMFVPENTEALELFNTNINAIAIEEIELDTPMLDIDELGEVELEPAKIEYVEWFIREAA